MSRLFVAVWPPDEVLDAVEALHRPVEGGGRWTRRDQWHVTLRFLAPADEDEVSAALTGLRHPPVEAVVGPEVGLLGEGVVQLPVAGLDSLAEAVVSLTAGVGRPPEDRPFFGHLTLARMAGKPPAGVLGQAFSATFPVDSVALVSSDLGGNATRYTTVATFPLVGLNENDGRDGAWGRAERRRGHAVPLLATLGGEYPVDQPIPVLGPATCCGEQRGGPRTS